MTDPAQALADPELAVLSAMAHGEDADTKKSVQIAVAAQLASLGLDEDRSTLYVDLVLNALSQAARRELQTMNPAKYEYQSDFARRYVAQGRHEGQLEGQKAFAIKLLAQRFGSLTEAARTKVADATIEELDAIAERLLTAATLQEAIG